jgi:hypothetical protein
MNDISLLFMHLREVSNLPTGGPLKSRPPFSSVRSLQQSPNTASVLFFPSIFVSSSLFPLVLLVFLLHDHPSTLIYF